MAMFDLLSLPLDRNAKPRIEQLNELSESAELLESMSWKTNSKKCKGRHRFASSSTKIR
jgi:hypothetical protein